MNGKKKCINGFNHEQLEKRFLLSGSFASVSGSGTLSVAGTSKDDSIQISLDATGKKVIAKLNGQSLTFQKSQVKRIWADGFGKNDLLVNLTSLPSTLLGSDGNDTMVGGSGNDSLDGGTGTDTADYSSRKGSWHFVTPDSDLIGFARSAAEEDKLNADVENYVGTNGNDDFTVNLGVQDLAYSCDGRGGNDTFHLGNGETATLLGGDGNDLFEIDDNGADDKCYGQGGNDTTALVGGIRPTFFDGGADTDSVDLTDSWLATFSLEGMPTVENVIGIGGTSVTNVIVTGNDLANLLKAAPSATHSMSLHGGAGNDTLIGGQGSDSLDGGTGTDTVDYSSRAGKWAFQVPFDDTEGSAISGSEQDTIAFGIDTIIGSNQDDTFGVTSHMQDAYVIDGRGGDDLFNLGNGETATIYGGSGNDVFSMSDDLVSDKCYGQAGNDVLQLLSDASVSFFDGGSGTDTVDATDCDLASISIKDAPSVEDVSGIGYFDFGGTVTVYGNDLSNRIEVSPHSMASAILIGNGGNDTLIGGVENDTLRGGAGDDVLDGGLGADDLIGDGGTDTADYHNRTEALQLSLDNQPNDGAAGEGDNIHSDIENILGGSAADLIVGNLFANSLSGGAGNDTIWGGKGNDTLNGGAGQDHLYGQDDNDLLLGKDGEKDVLDGGNGSDKAQRDHSQSVSDVVLNIETFVA